MLAGRVRRLLLVRNSSTRAVRPPKDSGRFVRALLFRPRRQRAPKLPRDSGRLLRLLFMMLRYLSDVSAPMLGVRTAILMQGHLPCIMLNCDENNDW